MVLLHGEAGGLDELIIAVVAFGVLYLAVKLAGRKPADDAEPDEEEQPAEAAQPPAAPQT
ncbi:MAG TPA: hypothetical protein VFG86_03485 [Chloroflexota bacterium]|jgi:hypothetical protein|nr:hypothetical protein [Chloroflexota bacterium]